MEERHLLSGVPARPAPHVHHDVDGAVGMLIEHWDNFGTSDIEDGVLVLATDGSEVEDCAASGWATRSGGVATCADPVDRSSFLAEVFGMVCGVISINASIGRELHAADLSEVILVVDCMSAITVLRDAPLCAQWWGWQLKYRAAVNDLVRRGVRVTLEWTPSHDKKPKWKPVSGITAELARSLNKHADVLARGAAQRLAADPALAEWRKSRERAVAWSSRALAWAKEVDLLYSAHVDHGRMTYLA